MSEGLPVRQQFTSEGELEVATDIDRIEFFLLQNGLNDQTDLLLGEVEIYQSYFKQVKNLEYEARIEACLIIGLLIVALLLVTDVRLETPYILNAEISAFFFIMVICTLLYMRINLIGKTYEEAENEVRKSPINRQPVSKEVQVRLDYWSARKHMIRSIRNNFSYNLDVEAIPTTLGDSLDQFITLFKNRAEDLQAGVGIEVTLDELSHRLGQSKLPTHQQHYSLDGLIEEFGIDADILTLEDD